VDIAVIAIFLLLVLCGALSGLYNRIGRSCEDAAMLRMRAKGATYKEIGERFNMSASGARYRVLKAKKDGV
jgi:hypothetical protein